MRRIILTLGVILFTQPIFANVITGIQGHEVGDIIAVRTDADIAKYCNFDKQIVVTNLNVLCVYTVNKESKSGVNVKFGM